MARTSYLMMGLLLFAMAGFVLGQTSRLPSFDRYSSRVVSVKSKAPNLRTHKDAKLFRTALRNAAKEGVNFGGHFVLTNWGCGASCQVGAIIDAKTGEVFFPNQLQGFWSQDWNGKPEAFGFQQNSRLLMFLGFEPGDYNGQRQLYGYHIYRWTGRSLKKIKYIRQSFGEE